MKIIYRSSLLSLFVLGFSCFAAENETFEDAWPLVYQSWTGVSSQWIHLKPFIRTGGTALDDADKAKAARAWYDMGDKFDRFVSEFGRVMDMVDRQVTSGALGFEERGPSGLPVGVTEEGLFVSISSSEVNRMGSLSNDKRLRFVALNDVHIRVKTESASSDGRRDVELAYQDRLIIKGYKSDETGSAKIEVIHQVPDTERGVGQYKTEGSALTVTCPSTAQCKLLVGPQDERTAWRRLMRLESPEERPPPPPTPTPSPAPAAPAPAASTSSSGSSSSSTASTTSSNTPSPPAE